MNKTLSSNVLDWKELQENRFTKPWWISWHMASQISSFQMRTKSRRHGYQNGIQQPQTYRTWAPEKKMSIALSVYTVKYLSSWSSPFHCSSILPASTSFLTSSLLASMTSWFDFHHPFPYLLQGQTMIKVIVFELCTYYQKNIASDLL